MLAVFKKVVGILPQRTGSPSSIPNGNDCCSLGDGRSKQGQPAVRCDARQES